MSEVTLDSNSCRFFLFLIFINKQSSKIFNFSVFRSEQQSKLSPTFKKHISSAIIKSPSTNKLLQKPIKPVRTTIIGNLFSSTNKSDKNIILNGSSLEKTNLNVQKINKSNSGVLGLSKNVKVNGAASIKKIPTLIKCNKINPETKNISSTNSSLHSSSSSLSENSPKLFIKNINNNNLNNNSIKEAALEVI